ncbi:MAG: DNA-binding protein [Pseudanabaena sp. SU_2_4]|nr:DNA-binding protein [Pseudanabaena sp. SU_2_4]
MPRDKTLRVRLNQREFDKIQLLAQQHDIPMSEVVRD